MVCLVENNEKGGWDKNDGRVAQQRVNQMIKSAEGGAGLLHKITKPAAWRRGAQILKKEEEDARLLDRCEAKRKEWSIRWHNYEWAKHWQCDESVQNTEDKPWEIRI